MPYLRAQFCWIPLKSILDVCLRGDGREAYVYDSENVRITRDQGVFKNKKGLDHPDLSPGGPFARSRKKEDAWTDFQAIRDKRKELMDLRACWRT